MPKKIDYVVFTPVSPSHSDNPETAEEENANRAPGGPGGPRGPRGRSGPNRGGPNRGGGTGARPNTGYRGPGGGGGGFRRPGPGGPGGAGGRGPGGPGGGAGAATGTPARRGFGGMSRMAPLERPTPKVELPPFLTVKDLADALSVNPTEVIREMMKHNVLATINQQIDYDTAAIVAIGLGYEVTQAVPEVEEDLGETL